MKKYFIYAASALALASCQSDDFLGNDQGTKQDANNLAIQFNGGTGKTTRADKTGQDAATALNKSFVVFGYKTTGDNKSTVYDHYNVNYIADSNGKTQSNTAGWEYVGQATNALNTVNGSAQTIKYWDYSANQYDFVAFSFGSATQGTGDTKVEASKVSQTPSYTLTGKVDELVKCFIADRVTAKDSSTDGTKIANKLVGYKDAVSFNFRSLKAMVRMAIYETVPGYSIKDVKYYVNGTEGTPTGTNPTLYAKDKSIPAGKGTMTITFGPNDETTATDYNQAKAKWTVEGENSSTITWNNDLSLKEPEANEATGKVYIGRDITSKSESEYKDVLPGTTIEKLTLKVDYTLVSTDGSKEEIKVKGATATIPDVYTQWKPNYAYTYIFKISDKTNGSTGGTSVGLYPITFDAVVTETETGKQETITTVAEPSITTYSKDSINNEYKKGNNIYVSVNDADLNLTGDNANCALYTAESNTTITEAYVELCLKNKTGDGPWSLNDGTNNLTVKKANGLSIADKIDA